jgi:serine protease inhibitor
MMDMKKGAVLLLCLTLAVGMLAGCFTQPAQPVESGQNNSSDPNSLTPAHSINQSKNSAEVIKGNTAFAFRLFQELNQEDQEDNIFISPLSISTALAMTYQGAGSTTKEAMAKALGYSGIEDKKINDSYQNLIPYLSQLDDKVKLSISNSVWVKEGEEIQPAFLQANQEIFRAFVKTLDFEQAQAADEINRWISEATNKKIEKMIDSPIAPDIIMYLINAIYFKGDWAQQFDAQNTFESKFQLENGNTDKVMMMSRKGKVEYGQGEDYQVVRLPYGKGKAAMYCVLPSKGMSLSDFIASLDADRWQAIKESIVERDEVLLQLPRFKLEYGIKNLNQSLTSLGMGEAFTDNADFSGIRQNVCISRVLHKAIIEVNEEGSEAAAATAVEMMVTAVAEPLAFIADRPFLFLIAEEETGTILFMGKFYKAG